jgi:c(7)-type cytochrome triheme protein
MKLLRKLAVCSLIGILVGMAVARETRSSPFVKPAPHVLPVDDEPLPLPGGRVQEEPHPARSALDRNPIYDETNPDFWRLQRIQDATASIKRDAVGFPDWMAALRSGKIAPRAGLSPAERMNVMDFNVVMKNTREMPHVLFPHLSHTLWLDCSNCHPVPFLPQVGANPVSMSEIFRGRYCGMCHDRVAFITFFSCERCHSVKQATGAR